MLTFLAPWAWLGSALLAIPIIVHLFKPRRVRRMPFSSLRWLHLTPQRLSRRIKWHQVFLFLLRATFILLLVAALARPLLVPKGSTAARERFLVIDLGRSMDYRAADQPTPIHQAKTFAEDVLTHTGGDDRVSLLLAGAGSHLLQPLSRDVDNSVAALRNLKAGGAAAHFSAVLSTIHAQLAQRRPGAGIDVVFLTDNQQHRWNQGDIAAFVKDAPDSLCVQVVDVAAASPHNAWIADARLIQSTSPDRRFLRVTLGCVGDAGQERTVRLAGLKGLTERTQEVTLNPNRTTHIEFDLPPDLELADQVAQLRLEPADGLPSDDSFFLPLDAKGALHVLVVEAASNQPEPLRPGFHLFTALEALGGSSSIWLNLLQRTTAEVSPREITDADVIFLADVPALTEPQAAALESRVHLGAGLVIFLGSHVQPAFYNDKFLRRANPADGLLPLPLKTAAEAGPAAGGLAGWSSLRWQHPLLARMFDPLHGDLAQVRSRSFFRFDGEPPDRNAVLAWIENSVPAILEHRAGSGKVLVFNTTANDDWSDLPRRKSFVPLVDRLLAYLSGSRRRMFEAGESATLNLSGIAPGEVPTVACPDGSRQRVRLEMVGGKTVARVGVMTEPGVYWMEWSGGERLPFVVHAARADSVLAPMDPAVLAGWWAPAAFEHLSPEEASRRLTAATDRLTLWPWLFALACLVFLAEMFFVHWLCPRVHPHVVDSVVHQQRILTPLKR